jgi:hypothetical protein
MQMIAAFGGTVQLIEICQFVPIKTTLLEQSSQLIISNKIKKKGEQLIFK